jgi:hypothetical protein
MRGTAGAAVHQSLITQHLEKMFFVSYNTCRRPTGVQRKAGRSSTPGHVYHRTFVVTSARRKKRDGTVGVSCYVSGDLLSYCDRRSLYTPVAAPDSRLALALLALQYRPRPESRPPRTLPVCHHTKLRSRILELRSRISFSDGSIRLANHQPPNRTRQHKSTTTPEKTHHNNQCTPPD